MSLNKTNIEWCDYSWNPMVGCTHNCYGCYANDLHTKRHKALLEGKKVPERYRLPFNKVQLFPKSLKDPYKLKKPSIIFVVSMGDLFCKSVPKEWITAVKNVMQDCRQHTFMLLTKNPNRYSEFVFSENVWLGCSVPNLACPAVEYGNGTFTIFNKIQLTTPDRKNKTFVSIEPIRGNIDGEGIRSVDLAIVGAMTGSKKIVPKKEWVNSVEHKNIFYKSNIVKYFPELAEKNIDVKEFIKNAK